MSGPDGPAGLRLTQSFTVGGTTYYQFTTAWPISTMRAQTWNTALLEEMGEAVGEEMVEYGAQMWLAPGMNIHRDPRNGRNFEYYSEDPLLTGETATAITAGVQTKPGVGVTLKHYAGNNQETNRGGGKDTIN
jgi:beta-glucosidase